MNQKTILLAAGMALLMVVAGVSQTSAGPKHHIVFQMTEPQSSWGALPLHVVNTREVFAKDGGSQVEVVFYGAGLKMLLKTNTEHEAKLKQLADSGVTLAACQNAMKFMNIKTEDLFPFVTQVDSGISEIVRKQEAGWSYIH
jgi:intracellular sulfur oxidation DsrE/DsrF family protein